MKYPTVSVNGVSVRVDNDGRYNLNDLHAAAVANGQASESQRPGAFMQSNQVKRFVRTLSDAMKVASVKVVKGGTEQGTWGLELVAIRYAAWLSPLFEIKVYETFQMVIRKGIDAMSRLNRIDHVINSETKTISQCASQMAKWGVGGRKQLLHTYRDRAADEVQLYLPGFGNKAIE
ncbi:KilA-N domain-containing protein [Enterobacter quasiroggenkampii]|uniref:KilA-N domain-containing protein n=1 Tax=Enterobacter quasiroggenkampii TaxID=2497436 RepID=UPI0021CFF43D|nr:KilA-N domain-containing protein [Enterobacter quasiroggenkampii]MCU6407455.1 KilA-N domain-containing protein [Enterobacter quasiroggenkampii]